MRKGKIDYKIFEKNKWTSEELIEIEKYLKQDLNLTKNLWNFLIEKFDSLKEHISEKDAQRFKHITMSSGAYGYKVICHLLGLKEEYNDIPNNPKYEGAYVMQPKEETIRGNILYFDFASLYPMMYVHANLFSPNCKCCSKEEKWHGNENFKIDGYYCSKQQGKIEDLIKEFYMKRKLYKTNKDKRQFAIKIILNCFSEDTEILTEQGVKKIIDCKKGEQVYSMDIKTGKTELKKINEIFTKKYNDKMYHFKDKNKDLIVTPEHDMLFKSNKNSNIQKIKAKIVSQRSGQYPNCKPINGKIINNIDMKQFCEKDYIYSIKLKNSYSQRKNNNLIYNQNLRTHFSKTGIDENLEGNWLIQGRQRDMKTDRFLPIKDLLYFIGIFLAEGSSRISTEKFYDNENHRGISYNCQIVQSKEKNTIIYNKIKQTLKNLNIRYSHTNKYFNFSSKFWYDFFKKMKTNSFNIKLSEWIFELDSSLLKYLHEGLYDGDGNKNQYRYSTVSKQLRDDMIKLNLHLGYRCRYTKEDYITKIRKKENTIWRIHRTTIGWYKKFGEYGGKIINNPTNKIVCLNVKDNHTVFAGRNGKFVWTGQSLYGISAKPSFKQIYNKHTASDCTALARQCIHFAIKKFEDNMYDVIYGDTDSVIIKLKPYQKTELCKQLAEDISIEISQQFPFPFDEFNLKVDDELKYLQFFIGKDGNFNKKHYLYVNNNKQLKTVGLDIIRKDCSNISLKIFEELKEDIIKNLDCKFEESLIVDKINSTIKEDKTIIAKRFNIKPLKDYKSKTSIYYLIGEKYGDGEIFLIKNYKLGAGKGIKYCSVDEAKDLETEDLNLEDVYRELGVFIKDYKGYNINKKKKSNKIKKIKETKLNKQIIL